MKIHLKFIKKIISYFLPNFIKKIRSNRMEILRHNAYKNYPPEQIFKNIYLAHDWGAKNEFYSGIGSHEDRIILPYIFSVKQIFSQLDKKPIVVDIGSGDFNVGSKLIDFCEKYIALDIVKELQLFNRKKYFSRNVEFLHLNAIDDDLPKGDVVILRQVLQHLNNEQISTIIKKCYAFSRWIITEHVPVGDFVANKDISTGCGIRLLIGSGVDVLLPPFNVSGFEHKILCEVESAGGLIKTTYFEKIDKDILEGGS